MSTFTPSCKNIERSWHLMDATSKPLGRLATDIARILRGKHKAVYTPHMDMGDYVVVVNSEKTFVTGSKKSKGGKMYYTHTGRPGSLKQRDFNQMLEKDPARPLKLAVKGMLPRGPLGRQMLAKLKVVIGSEHPYIAQQPKEYVDNFKHTSEGE